MLVEHGGKEDDHEMIARNFTWVCSVLATLSLALCPDASAGSKGATVPGTYRDWNGDLDEVTIVQPFRLDTYNDIAVESFDATRVPLPDPNDNTYPAVRSALARIKPAFIDGFQSSLRHKAGANEVARSRGPRPNTLVIRARLTKMDPGSQAARYFGGFGMGAVKVAIVGEIIDASSRKTLVRFAQERRSGFGAFGGGYGELFVRSARQIGEDVAGLLNAF
ncbi:MAG: hypothetical protein QOE34_2361 [Verrucomicrobiota bacterium]|jgi:hypothetical protein